VNDPGPNIKQVLLKLNPPTTRNKGEGAGGLKATLTHFEVFLEGFLYLLAYFANIDTLPHT